MHEFERIGIVDVAWNHADGVGVSRVGIPERNDAAELPRAGEFVRVAVGQLYQLTRSASPDKGRRVVKRRDIDSDRRSVGCAVLVRQGVGECLGAIGIRRGRIGDRAIGVERPPEARVTGSSTTASCPSISAMVRSSPSVSVSLPSTLMMAEVSSSVFAKSLAASGASLPVCTVTVRVAVVVSVSVPCCVVATTVSVKLPL